MYGLSDGINIEDALRNLLLYISHDDSWPCYSVIMIPRGWICLVVIPYMVISTSASMTNSELRDEIKATGKTLFRALRDSAMDCSVKCKSRKPRIMCGSDGVSYMSKCEVKRARRCEGKKITIKRKGKCSDQESKCFQEKADAQATINRGGSTEAFIPDCNDDGTYAEIQCHYANGSRYCWCVSSDGRPVPNTSTKDDKPSCKSKKSLSDETPTPLYTNINKNSRPRPKKEKKRRKQKKSKSKRCSFKERTRFNTNLVRVFTEEYNRSIMGSSSNKPTNGDAANDLAKQVVDWKFSHYDDNQDNLLQRKEVNALRRLVKKFIKPRSCAKRFLKFCDNDHDKLITRREWSLCLSTDLNRKEHQETTTHEPEVKPTGESLDLNKLLNKKSSSSSSSSSSRHGLNQRETKPSLPVSLDETWPDFSRPRPISKPRTEKQPNDCLTERQSALEQESDNPKAGIFIPTCTPEGTWNKAQCHKTTGYCWCVEEDSGRPISGTSTQFVEPKCDFEGDRLIPDPSSVGCTFAEKQSFVADLLNTLSTEMEDYALNNSTDHSKLVIDPNKTLHERAVEWKFAVLDANNNQDLENAELDNFKETLKKAQKKETRKCARKFVRYCDESENKKVSRQEWIDCMGITRNININLPSNPKRTGTNPFDKYLVDN